MATSGSSNTALLLPGENRTEQSALQEPPLPFSQGDVTFIPPQSVDATSALDPRNEETIVPAALSGVSEATEVVETQAFPIGEPTALDDIRQHETLVPTNTEGTTSRQNGPAPSAATAVKAVDGTVTGATKLDTTQRSRNLRKPKKGLDLPGYQVLSVLGRGGMGVVYKARHVRLNRLVALKMMLSGTHASAEQCARFRSEAEAVARLQHPNIVQIYEIGEHEGRPFFSLELVNGGSLEKMLQGTPQPPRQAAELVEMLARAMDVAHQAGIIHRDLKPANVLLQMPERLQPSQAINANASVAPCNLQSAIPKVTDFGLAKHIDSQEGQTQTGAIMGTPSYMAPEQAAGKTKQLGPGVDIYALGSILYDLLTGRPPFQGETVMDTLNQVQCMEPLPPVRLQPKVPRDLETICLKCLQKEPTKRYVKSLDLADDLRRFLENKPIAARPVSIAERVVKWTRRRPAAAALIVVSTAAVLGLGIGGLVFARQERQRANEALALRAEAEDNAQTALAQEAKAKEERLHAQTNFQYARAAVDEMLTRVGQDDLAHEPRMEKVRRDLLHKALKFYERFVHEQSDDPRMRWEMGRAQQRVGDIQELLGEHEASVQAYNRAAEILGPLTNEDKQQPDYRQDLATTQNNLGIVLQAAGRRAEAERAYRDALANKTQLVADFPAVPAYRRELASALNNRGIFLQTQNEPREAERAYNEARSHLEGLTHDFPENADYQQELARTCSNLGVLLQTAHRAPDAEAAYRQATDVLNQLAVHHPGVPEYQKEYARSLLNLGVLLQMNKAYPKAEDFYRQAALIFVKLSKDFPGIPEYRHQLAISYNNLGNLNRELHRVQQAETLWRQSSDLFEKLVGEVQGVPIYRQELARGQNELGVLLASSNRPREAEAAWQRSISLQSKLVEEFPGEPSYQQELARSLGNLGILMAQLNRLDGAERNFHKAIALLATLQGQFPSQLAYGDDFVLNQTNLAHLLSAEGRHRDAETAWEAIVQAQSKLVHEFPNNGGFKADLAKSKHSLGRLLHDRNENNKARELLRSAVDEQRLALRAVPRNGSYRDSLCTYYLSLADVEVSLENHVGASESVKELLTVVPANWQNYQRAACLLASCAGLARQDSKATAAQRQAYCEQAVALLSQAWSRGYQDTSYLRTAEELDVLRDRDDFRKLLAQMESSATTKRP